MNYFDSNMVITVNTRTKVDPSVSRGVVFSLRTEVFMIDPLISRLGIGNLKSWLGKKGNPQGREMLTLLEIINDQTLF